jgi:hypothetical protein
VRPQRARRRKRRRRGRVAFVVVLVLVVFALGIALGEALHDNPKPGGTQTVILTFDR